MISPEEIVGNQLRLEDLKKKRAFQERIDALVKLPEFKAVIIDGFCRDHTAACTHQAFDPAASQEVRADAMQMASAGGHFLRWLHVGEQQRDLVQREINDIEQLLLEVAADN